MGSRRNRRTTGSNVPGLSGTLLLSNRDWVYSLSLLIPLVIYDLTLKHLEIASQSGDPGLGETLGAMQLYTFFNLGYASLWVGLFAAARGGLLRRAVVLLFHVATMLMVVVATLAYLYFRRTGGTLDYGVIAGWIPRLDETQPVLYMGEGPLSVWVVLSAALLYAAFGPQIVTRAVARVARRRGWTVRRSPEGTPPKLSFFGSLGIFLLALGFGWLSVPASTESQPDSNLALTGLEETSSSEEDDQYASPSADERSATDKEETTGEEDPDPDSASDLSAIDAILAETPRTEKRNVVLIHLESTRAQSATPYNKDLKTMPFLGELAKQSLVAERAYAVVPRSSKGSTAVNCGVEPPHYPGPEFEPGRIPSPCLGGLLKEQGYKTVWFQSVSDAANGGWDGVLARNFGFEEFYSPETMNKEGFQVTNSFGFEEDIMLGPSEGWLANNGYDGPFLAQYFTGTGHYGYDCVPNRYGYERFSPEDEELDRYHNCLRMLDFFLQNLFDQYRRLGLYEDTIFVLYGDHGEGFREHNGRYMHGDTIYEEGMRVPLIVHDPKRFEDGGRAKGLSSQIDVLPTVVDLLGYEVEDGGYPGYSLLHTLPEDRIVRFNCIGDRKCMASIRGYEKYIYHYDELSDEFFDLSEDPLEQNDLADERSKEEMDERREDLFSWRRRDDAEYGPVTFEGVPYRGAASEEE